MLEGDDLEVAYHINHRYLEPVRKAGKLNRAVENWYQKVELMWAIAASGNDIHDDGEQSEAQYTAAEAAKQMGVTNRQARHLATIGALPGATKHGRDWLIPRTAVDDYLERRRMNGRARPRS